MQEMKVLMVATSSEMSSGATHSLIGLVSSLQSMGVPVDVVLPMAGDCETEMTEHGINFQHIQYFSYPFWVKGIEKNYHSPKTVLKALINVVAHIKIFILIIRQKYDIVHINALTSCLGANEAVFLGRKLVWHAREFLEEDLNACFTSEKRSRKLLGKADKVIAVSKAVASKQQAFTNSANITVVYNGVSQSFFAEHKRLFRDDEFKILVVGRVTPKKNQMLACRAAYELVNHGLTSFRLCIVGKKEDMGYVGELNEYINSHGIDGFVSIEEPTNHIEEKYQESDVLLVCADNEAFGRTTVEAMLAGCLVIGSNSGGTSELIENGRTGLKFIEGDARSLAACLQYAANHPELANEMAQRANCEAIRKFTETQNAKNVLKVYREAMTK